MTSYAGLDVSESMTHLCVLDERGQVVARGVVSTDPQALGRWLARHAPNLELAVLETGARAAWLVHGLRAKEVPVVCTCARQAKGALKHGPHKSDRSDAEGLARLAVTGWTKPVHIRSAAAFERKALVSARDHLVKMRARLIVAVRGLLKPFGLTIGKAHGAKFQARVGELTADFPELGQATGALLAAAGHLADQIRRLDRTLLELAKHDPICRRLMTIPGVGPLTAQTFVAVVDDPSRFRRSEDVGAYLGLTPRQWQSGQIDQQGHITRCGDDLTRHLLYECANNLLAIVKQPSALKAWAERLEARLGAKKARVALARKLAVLMHRLCIKGEPFEPFRHAA